MHEALFVPFSLVATSGLVLIFLVRKLVHRDPMLPVSTDWIQELDPGRYRPMARLLGGSDADLLKRHPGSNRGMKRRVDRERRRLFREYLKQLREDFYRVCTALELMMTHSSYDRPELAIVLLHQRFRFFVSIALAEFRLFLNACGWDDVPDMVAVAQPLGVLAGELRRMLPPPRSTAVGQA